MYVAPNNRLSNHFRKKKVEKHVWFDDQTVSGSFYQNIKAMGEKTKTGMFYEEHLNICFSNNHTHSIHPNPFCNNYLSSMPNLGNGFGMQMNLFDNDGLSDWEEAAIYGTDWTNPDCDDDGLLDGEEIHVYGTDPLNPDTDGDGLTDGEEVVTYGTDPTKPDTDGDKILDGWNVTHEAFLP